MFTGLDIGGTNTDIAIIDSEIKTHKIPNTSGLSTALKKAGSSGRLVVSTSQPLNEILTGPQFNIRTITIPGPGLVYSGAIKGAVSHRGDIIEPIDTEEVKSLFKGPHPYAVAISGKFSVRNNSLEEQVCDVVSEYLDPEQIAVSSHIGALNFPARIKTTQINARIKPKVNALNNLIREVNADFFYVTSTGGLTSPDRALQNPSLLYHSSPATVANGAYYLTRNENCLVLDIGGTTTELIPIAHGKPIFEDVIIDGFKTLIKSVKTVSIPYGGDSCIRETLCPFRAGNARSFGGGEPTLTDALNVSGARIGDDDRSHVIDKKIADNIVEQYLITVSSAVKKFKPGIIIGTGYLAHYLLSEISERAKTTGIVPEHAGSANAVGAAVSRISILGYFHVDTEKKRMTMNGKEYPYYATSDDEELLAHAKNIIRDVARADGAPEEDVEDVMIQFFSSYEVVRGWKVAAKITDILLSIAPGISVEAA
ncbi:MAG: hydantoinase/oxoprolinase family protein [Methanomicrobiales archaeon]|nr:hydantoinase/oxoprolinase family protein [Methanomicrobiales archaeon]